VKFRGKCAENKQNPSADEVTTSQSKPAKCLSVNTGRGRKAESRVSAKVNRRSKEEVKHSYLPAAGHHGTNPANSEILFQETGNKEEMNQYLSGYHSRMRYNIILNQSVLY
jgi:hypothetical protein